MSHNKTKGWYIYLAVELSAKIQTLLGEDGDLPPYEYINESTQIISEVCSKKMDIFSVESVISEVLSSSLEYNYSPENFREIAEFLSERLRSIAKYMPVIA
jgi:hypothetical protein